MTCDRCALLAGLCEACRKALGCKIREAIERLPGWEVDGA